MLFGMRIQEYHIEQKAEANVTVEQKGRHKSPYLWCKNETKVKGHLQFYSIPFLVKHPHLHSVHIHSSKCQIPESFQLYNFNSKALVTNLVCLHACVSSLDPDPYLISPFGFTKK